MPRKAAGMVYEPAFDSRKRYKKKSDAYVIREVKAARRAAEQIREVSEEVEAALSDMTILHERMVDLFTSKHDLGIPESKRYVDFDAKSAKAPDIIFRVMGMLMAPLEPRYIAPNKKEKSQDDAMAIQAHVRAVYNWLRRKYQSPFDVKALFWQLLLGRSYIQQTYLPYYWDKSVRARKTTTKTSKKAKDQAEDSEEYEEAEEEEEVEDAESDQEYLDRWAGYKGYAGPPFFVEALDPRMTFPIRRPTGVEAYLKIYTVERYTAEESFERAGKPIAIEKVDGKNKVTHLNPGRAGMEMTREASSSATDTVTYYEYIDERYIYYVIEDEVVHAYDHRGAITISPSYALVTGFAEAELESVGILFAVRNEIPQFDFLRTLWVNRAYIDVFPQLFVELDGSQEPLRDQEGNPEQWDIEPMTIKQIRGRVSNPFKEAQSGVDYRAAVEALRVDIDEATISSLARGVGGAQQPGYSINQLSQAMRTIWKPIIESRETQWANLFEHYLWCVKNVIKEECTVFAEVENAQGFRSGEYLSLEPEDIQDFYQIYAELKPDLPVDKLGNMQVWMKAGQEGWATEEEVSNEGFGKPDWRVRRKQIDRDVARRTMLPQATEDAIKLGKVRLESKIAEEMGLSRLNPVFNQSLESMRNPGGASAAPGPAGGPAVPGAPGPEQGNVVGGAGIPPTAGAPPADAAPGPRMGQPAMNG